MTFNALVGQVLIYIMTWTSCALVGNPRKSPNAFSPSMLKMYFPLMSGRYALFLLLYTVSAFRSCSHQQYDRLSRYPLPYSKTFPHLFLFSCFSFLFLFEIIIIIILIHFACKTFTFRAFSRQFVRRTATYHCRFSKDVTRTIFKHS